MKTKKCLLCGMELVYDDSFGTEVCPYCKLPSGKERKSEEKLKQLINEIDKKLDDVHYVDEPYYIYRSANKKNLDHVTFPEKKWNEIKNLVFKIQESEGEK